MRIIAYIALGFGMLVTLCATLLIDVQLLKIGRDQWRGFSRSSRQKRRAGYLRLTVLLGLFGGYCALLITAPLGLRDTVLVCFGIPLVILLPAATVAAGIYGHRGRRSR